MSKPSNIICRSLNVQEIKAINGGGSCICCGDQSRSGSISLKDEKACRYHCCSGPLSPSVGYIYNNGVQVHC